MSSLKVKAHRKESRVSTPYHRRRGLVQTVKDWLTPSKWMNPWDEENVKEQLTNCDDETTPTDNEQPVASKGLTLRQLNTPPLVTSTPQAIQPPGRLGDGPYLAPVNKQHNQVPLPTSTVAYLPCPKSDSTSLPTTTTSVESGPSFSVSTFHTPIHNTLSLSKSPFSSPYYSGRTSYGGRGMSSSMFRKRARIEKSPSKELPLTRYSVVPSNKVGGASSLVGGSASQTARKIMGTLECLSTPLQDARKLPLRTITPAAKKRCVEIKSLPPPVCSLSTPTPAALSNVKQPVVVPSEKGRSVKGSTVVEFGAGLSSFVQQSGSQEKVPQKREIPRKEERNVLHHQIVQSGGKMKKPRNSNHYITHKASEEDNVSIPLSLPSGLTLSNTKPFSLKPPTTALTTPLTAPTPQTAPIVTSPYKVSSSTTPTLYVSSQTTPIFTSPFPVATSAAAQSGLTGHYVFRHPRDVTVPISSNNQGQAKGKGRVEDECDAPLKSISVLEALKQPQFKIENIRKEAHLAAHPTWSCDQCHKANSTDVDCCIKCGNRKCQETKMSSDADTKSSGEAKATDIKSTGPPASIDQSRDQPIGVLLAPPPDNWECNTCLVSNEASNTSCVACGTPATGTGSQSKIGSGEGLKIGPGIGGLNWECNTCLISNKPSDALCIACGAPATVGPQPGAKMGSDGGLKIGSGGGLKIGSGGDFKVGSNGGLKIGSGGNLKVGSGVGLKIGSGGDLKVGSDGGLKIGSGGDLKVGSDGGLKIGSGGDLKVGSDGGLKIGGGLQLAASGITPKVDAGIKLGGNDAKVSEGFKMGSGGGLKLEGFKPVSGGGLKLEPNKGFAPAAEPNIKLQLGSSEGLKPRPGESSKPESSVGLKPELSAGFKLGSSKGLKPELNGPGLSTELKQGSSEGPKPESSGGGLKLGPTEESKLESSGGLKPGFKLGFGDGLKPESSGELKSKSSAGLKPVPSEGLKPNVERLKPKSSEVFKPESSGGLPGSSLGFKLASSGLKPGFQLGHSESLKPESTVGLKSGLKLGSSEGLKLESNGGGVKPGLSVGFKLGSSEDLKPEFKPVSSSGLKLGANEGFKPESSMLKPGVSTGFQLGHSETLKPEPNVELKSGSGLGLIRGSSEEAKPNSSGGLNLGFSNVATMFPTTAAAPPTVPPPSLTQNIFNVTKVNTATLGGLQFTMPPPAYDRSTAETVPLSSAVPQKMANVAVSSFAFPPTATSLSLPTPETFSFTSSSSLLPTTTNMLSSSNVFAPPTSNTGGHGFGMLSGGMGLGSGLATGMGPASGMGSTNSGMRLSTTLGEPSNMGMRQSSSGLFSSLPKPAQDNSAPSTTPSINFFSQESKIFGQPPTSGVFTFTANKPAAAAGNGQLNPFASSSVSNNPFTAGTSSTGNLANRKFKKALRKKK